MKKINSITLILLALLVSFSCDDIVEEDISDDIIQIVTPTEGAVIEGNTVPFSWQYIDGADDYRIQIYTTNQVYEVDSLVQTNNFTYNLNPGNYQWRVRGENFAYESPFTFPVSFTVEASNDLSTQTVVLQTPSSDFYTNDPNLIFTWDPIMVAESYELELVKTLSGQQTVFQQDNITQTSFSVSASVFDEDSEYIWKVKAVNATSETMFTERSVFIDRVVPNQPTLSSPIDQETLTSTIVIFNWLNGADTGNIQSEITNTIEFSTDINFTTLIYSADTNNNSYQYDFESIGNYYWRIKAIDLATNESDYSIVRSITIQ